MDKQIDVLKKQRLDWIDGLRGICCILIFVHHFLLIFYPGTYSGNAVPSHMIAKLDIYLAQSPFASLFNGNFLVCIFCVVSAVSISYSIFRRTDLKPTVKVYDKTVSKIGASPFCYIIACVFYDKTIVV